MCRRSAHVPNTRFLKAFELTRHLRRLLAWRLRRMSSCSVFYGHRLGRKSSWLAYIQRMEEAEKARSPQDRQRSGPCFPHPEEAPGMVFWHPNGWTIYQVLEQYMRNLQRACPVAIRDQDPAGGRSRGSGSASRHWEALLATCFTTEFGKPRTTPSSDDCPVPRCRCSSGPESSASLPTASGRVRSATVTSHRVRCTSDARTWL